MTFSAFPVTRQEETEMVAKWEYKVDSWEPRLNGGQFTTAELENYLDIFGDEGWELAALTGHEGEQTLFFTVVLKRPKDGA
jgi:hypothetical protein